MCLRIYDVSKVLFVIVNAPPEFPNEMKAQSQWSLERHEQGRSLLWDHKHRCFGDEAFRWQIEDGSKKLIPGLVREDIRALRFDLSAFRR